MERQSYLESTIDPTNLETKSYEIVKFLSFGCVPVMIVLAILQVSFFLEYNGRSHPFSHILEGTANNEGKQGQMSNPLDRQNTRY